MIFRKQSVFICHVREQKVVAELIFQKLSSSGFRVYLDRRDLEPGDSADGQLRALVQSADLFVFLMSKASLAPGRFASTELSWRKTSHPVASAENLLVVELLDVDREAKDYADPYLLALVAAEVKGDPAAFVAEGIKHRRSRKLHVPRLIAIALAVVVLATAIVAYLTPVPPKPPDQVPDDPVVYITPGDAMGYAKLGNRESGQWTERLMAVLAERESTEAKRKDWLVVNEWTKVRSGWPEMKDAGLIPAPELDRMAPKEILRATGIRTETLQSGVEHVWLSFERDPRVKPIYAVGDKSALILIPPRALNRKLVIRVAAFARASTEELAKVKVLAATLEKVQPDGGGSSIDLEELSEITESPRFSGLYNRILETQRDRGVAFEVVREITANESASFRLTLIQGVEPAPGANYVFYPLGIKLDQARTEILVVED